MNLRPYQIADTPALITLLRDVVHRVCNVHYDQNQRDAWAPKEIDEARWRERLVGSYTRVAEEDGVIVGFGNLEESGNIDTLYVHADWQRKGIAQALYTQIEDQAKRLRLGKVFADVSITARPFFIKQGFQIDRVYTKEFRDAVFSNALMSKLLVPLLDPH